VNRTLAQTISVIFQPLLMPSFLFLILLGFASNALPGWTAGGAMLVLAIVFLTTCVIPVLSLLALKFTGNISGDFFMKERQQRIIPFLFISLYYILTAYLFTTRLFFVNELLIASIQIVAALITVLALITFFWKISAHAMAMGGSLGMVWAVHLDNPLSKMLWPVVMIVFVSGLVMTARLKLNAHEPAEVWVGFALGLVFCFFGLTLLL
jgi:membrane-associated phospholipid phosphatase